jgi:hypothetical protein
MLVRKQSFILGLYWSSEGREEIYIEETTKVSYHNPVRSRAVTMELVFKGA